MFETAVVNEPSVFEPLEFYCTGLFPAEDARNLFLFFTSLLLSDTFISHSTSSKMLEFGVLHIIKILKRSEKNIIMNNIAKRISDIFD